jgi:hypothetical protein
VPDDAILHQSLSLIGRKEQETGTAGAFRHAGRIGKIVDPGELGRPAGEASDMARQRIRRSLMWTAAIALAASGCASCLNPVSPIPEEAVGRCAALPQACRNHVYIFLLCGQGPLDLGNMGGVRESLISLGYIKTYCGECCYSGYYKAEILRLHREDEAARFVVIGCGLGANTAAELTEAAQANGATIDLLVTRGGVAILNDPKNRPNYALRVIHLSGGGIDSMGVPLDGADNVQLADAAPGELPTHAFTMETLVQELTEVASRVSVVGPPQSPEEGPAPHTASEREKLPRDEWDFLKPSQPFAPPPAKPQAAMMPKVL